MALVLKDRVQETTTTTGTGTLTLGGAVTGYQSFSAIGNSNTTYYTIYAPGGTEWEVGIGTYTASGTTLSRTTVLASSNSGSLVSFSAGTKNVWCDYPAGKAVYYDLNGNLSTNSISEGFSNVAATGTTTTLTVASVPNYVVTGSGGQTYQLPDATTLPSGVNYTFNNNQSSGTIVVKNNSSTTIATIQAGGYVDVILLSNSIAAGSWDVHTFAPSNVSWSTNTLDYAGSITSATWNGNTVAYNRGGTGQSSAFVAGGVVYGSTTSALAVTPIGTSGQVLTSQGAGTPTWTTPTTGTVTSVAATAGTGISVTGSPITSSGTLNITNTAPDQTVTLTAGTGISTSGTYPNFTITNTSPSSGGTVTSVTGTSPVVSSGGTTPAISMPAATTSVSGYLTSTDWNTFNGKQAAGTYVTSVAATSPVTSTGGTTPTIAMPAASTSVSGYLTSTDWNTFNSKGSGTVTSVSATAPITSSGGATPNLAMPAATTSVNGYLTSTDWTTFNGKQALLVSGTNIKTINSNSILGSGDLTISASAAGSNTQVQYNNSGAFGASSSFTYSTSTGDLSAPVHNSTNGLTVNSSNVSVNYTIASGSNAFSVGPITTNSGVTVTVSSGQRWVVI
jgi:hypothetical protein